MNAVSPHSISIPQNIPFVKRFARKKPAVLPSRAFAFRFGRIKNKNLSIKIDLLSIYPIVLAEGVCYNEYDNGFGIPTPSNPF